jgi:hypothetical protein
MLRVALISLTFCAAVFGFACAAGANTIGCGGNSVSYAEVAPRHAGKPRRGPIQVLPHSLCADLIEDRTSEIESLQVTIDPRDSGVPGSRGLNRQPSDIGSLPRRPTGARRN